VLLLLVNITLQMVPTEVGSLRKLENLDLSFKDLSGFPTELFSITNLCFLHVRSNIPTEVGLAISLVELDLSGNQFSGTLLPEIEHLDHLELLGVNNNTLQGTIPDLLARMTHLWHIHLFESGLTGDIPESFYNATYWIPHFIVIDCDQDPSCSCCSRTDPKAMIIVEFSSFPWREQGED
jgi:hypothetical protein